MLAPSAEIIQLLATFAHASTAPTFARAGAAELRAEGLASDPRVATYRRVLNRAGWSPLRLSKLLGPLVAAFLAPNAPWCCRPTRRWSAAVAGAWPGRAGSATRCARPPPRRSARRACAGCASRWSCRCPGTRARGQPVPDRTRPGRGAQREAGLAPPHRRRADRTPGRLVRRWQRALALALAGDGAYLPDRGPVRRPLADRGDLRGSARPPGLRDAAAVGDPGDGANHALPLGPVQPGSPPGAHAASRGAPRPAGGLVRQARGYLRRCAGRHLGRAGNRGGSPEDATPCQFRTYSRDRVHEAAYYAA